jgi:hypothetical protein
MRGGRVLLSSVLVTWIVCRQGHSSNSRTRRMGWSHLCNFMRPFMDGAKGFRFLYFHVEFGGMRHLLCFITFKTWFWNIFVNTTTSSDNPTGKATIRE